MIRLDKERSIKYLNKSFKSFKKDLIRFSQAHHSGTFKDTSEAAPHMAIIDLACYVGDVLSYYQDSQFEELRGINARQISNISSNAKRKGYKPVGKRPASCIQTFFIEVPSTSSTNNEIIPDNRYTPVLRSNCKVSGDGVYFQSLEDIHFSASLPTFGTTNFRESVVSRVDSDGLPTHFAIKKDVQIVAGEVKTETFSINEFRQFKTITITDTDVIEILSVVDSDNNEWYEVDYLAQDTVLESLVNDNTDNDVVPYVINLKPVPRRFVKDLDISTNLTSLIFGSGDGINFDDELIPNIADYSIPMLGKKVYNNYSIDPQNFLKTRSLGLSPYNTTLTVTYRMGGGKATNILPKKIDSISSFVLDFPYSDLDASKKQAVIASLETLNINASEGGEDEETIDEIIANSDAYFSSQKRIVTPGDCIAHIKSMPQRFGCVSKVFAKNSIKNNGISSIDIHLLSKDYDGYLTQPSSSLIKNVSTHISKLKMISDVINIYGADIINIMIEFGVIISPHYKDSKSQLLLTCIQTISNLLHNKLDISQPITISEIESQLQQLSGIVSVYKFNVKNLFGIVNGIQYSSVRYDTFANTIDKILYCPKYSVFELKYPNKNIVGEYK